MPTKIWRWFDRPRQRCFAVLHFTIGCCGCVAQENEEKQKRIEAEKKKKKLEKRRRQRFMVGKLGAAVSPLLQLRKLFKANPRRLLYGIVLKDENSFFEVRDAPHVHR